MKQTVQQLHGHPKSPGRSPPDRDLSRSDNVSGTHIIEMFNRVHQIRLLITHRADGLVGQREENSSRPNARAQDSEFIGIYNNNNHWYAKVDSLNGNSHHVGPLDTDVVAAIYHDVLATRLHGFSYELNYPETTRTLKSFSGGFVLSEYDSCVLIRAKPRMRRSFQFGATDMTSSGSGPTRGSETSPIFGSTTEAVITGVLVSLVLLTKLMQAFVLRVIWSGSRESHSRD